MKNERDQFAFEICSLKKGAEKEVEAEEESTKVGEDEENQEGEKEEKGKLEGNLKIEKKESEVILLSSSSLLHLLLFKPIFTETSARLISVRKARLFSLSLTFSRSRFLSRFLSCFLSRSLSLSLALPLAFSLSLGQLTNLFLQTSVLRVYGG